MAELFSPTLGVLRGQQVEQNLAKAHEEGLSLAERLALKKAAGQLGSQNYFAGYEGVPGAERPQALKDSAQEVNPADFAALEAPYAEPFKLKRQAAMAGEIEATKDAARLEYGKNMMRSFYDMPGAQEASTQGVNAFGSLLQAPGSGVLAPKQDAPSAVERTFEITPTGPKFGMKSMSPFEQSMKRGEQTAREAATELGNKKFTQDELQNAHTVVRESAAVLKNAREQYMTTGQGRPELEAAQQDYLASRANLDALLQGKTAKPTTTASIPMGTPSPLAPNTLSPMKQQEIVKKDLEEKNTAVNKEEVALRERAKGQAVVRTVIDSLRDQFTKLNESGGITNTNKDAVSNLAAGAASSPSGQATGRLLGTKSQSLRNTIAQQRPILMTSIMKATGMTAKQMDSNVELKLWLATATDPTLDFQANMKALDTLEQLYGKELGSAAQTAQAAPSLPAGAKQIGTSKGKPVYQLPNGSKVIAD